MAHEISTATKITDIREIIPAVSKLHSADRHRNYDQFPLQITLKLYHEKHITEADLLLTALIDLQFFYYLDGGTNYLKNRFKHIKRPDVLRPLKAQMLSVELQRGDLETEVSPYIRSFHHIEGTHYFYDIMQRMKTDKLERGNSYYHHRTRTQNFSHLLKHSTPSEDETFANFSTVMDALKLSRKRSIEVACFATQWADWLGDYLNIEDLGEGVWWFLAHTTDYMTAEKETVISRYSNIPKNDFVRGAIDINWFRRVYSTLGKTNWKLLHESAKYLSDGMGYRRVKIYSSVLLGETKIRETLKKITDKRDKDYVMALG